MKRGSACLLLAMSLGALVGVAADARAQSAKATAEAAFRKGKELMTSGDTAGACAAFEDSEKLDPQLGTQYNLALCDEKLGKLTSAWINFSEVAAKDTRGGRQADSARRAKALEPRLARLVIAVAAPVPDETVKVGALDLSVLAGSASPVDEGSYAVVASAPGFAPWYGRVEVHGEGKTITVDVPALAATPAQVVAERPVPPPVPPRRSHRRLIGVVVTGAGVVAVGAGLAVGHDVFELRDQARSACGGSLAPCTGDLAAAQALVDRARTRADWSDALVGVGAAAIIGGVILAVTAPHAARETAVAPLIGPDRVGLSFAATF